MILKLRERKWERKEGKEDRKCGKEETESNK
jgi:hypothetical protein